jgi:hypothetical protein
MASGLFALYNFIPVFSTSLFLLALFVRIPAVFTSLNLERRMSSPGLPMCEVQPPRTGTCSPTVCQVPCRHLYPSPSEGFVDGNVRILRVSRE